MLAEDDRGREPTGDTMSQHAIDHEHSVFEEYTPGYWRIARPLRAPWDVRVKCDHRWHPADSMIGWFCCRCGDERDGMPSDGRGWLGRLLLRLRPENRREEKR